MRKFGFVFTLISISLALAGCAKTPDATVAAAPPPDANAAADGNLAPVTTTQAAQQYPAQQYPAQAPQQYQDQNAPAPADYSSAAYQDAAYQDVGDDSGQTVYAPQPPPPLPEYSQPPCPGDNYLWTPGSWSYADSGYYWVPGVWVLAPYVDALWTPPYWDFYGGATVGTAAIGATTSAFMAASIMALATRDAATTAATGPAAASLITGRLRTSTSPLFITCMSGVRPAPSNPIG